MIPLGYIIARVDAFVKRGFSKAFEGGVIVFEVTRKGKLGGG